jgi:hypothetical protein
MQQEKPSALKNMKILDFFLFFGSFLPSCIRIRNLNADPDPDPATQINADPCGSGSETLYLID